MKAFTKVDILDDTVNYQDFAISPSEEYSPVVGPNTKKDITTEVISTTRSAVPIFMLECAFKIMAMISVPPLDAPMLNKTADPTAGRKIAKISSSIGWSVMVPANGTKRSRALKLKDISIAGVYRLNANIRFPKIKAHDQKSCVHQT